MKVIFLLGFIMTILGIILHVVAYIANKIYRNKTVLKSIEKNEEE